MASRIAFGPFLLDRAAGRVWREGKAIDLRPKAWGVLCHLVERPGELVTPRELLDGVWGGVAVTPQVLINAIAQLRAALGDDPRRPRILQTVHARGYRFIAPLEAAPPGAPAAPAPAPRTEIVGRDDQLRALRAAWQRALAGFRQLVFVAGESGIGKTALAESFTREMARAGGDAPLVAHGHCSEHHGRYQPYLPVLAALEKLAAGLAGPRVRAILRRHGPTWLIQIPGLVPPERRALVERSVLGTTAARMLCEGAGAIETLSRVAPVLLVLEDLHWCDEATLDLVAMLARRTTPARVLLLATYRPPDSAAQPSTAADLADRLVLDGLAARLELGPLAVPAVAAYLAARLADPERAAALAPLVEARSAGNPLFVRSLVDQMLDEGPGTPAGDPLAVPTPRPLEALVRRRLGSLAAIHRETLEAASVWADPFRPAEIAGAIDRAPGDVEAACDTLARAPRLLRPAGEASDPRYAFVHTAYRHAVYAAIPAPRRRDLHRRIGEALEGREGGPDAAALATHFRSAGHVDKAVHYLRAAADTALARFAHREAAACFAAAANLLRPAPDGVGRHAAEAQVQIQLGGALVILNGFASLEARRAFRHAGELLELQPSFVEQFGVDMSLALCELTAARWLPARTHTERLLAMSETVSPLEPVACCWAAYVESGTGHLERARTLLERGAAGEPFPGVPMHLDVRRMIDSQLALVLIELGFPAAGRARRSAALARSRSHGTQLDLAHAALWAAEAAVLADDRRAGSRLAAFGVEVSGRNAFQRYLVQCRLYAAWFDPALTAGERVRRMQAALEERRAFGDRWQESVALGLIAAAQRAATRVDDALVTLEHALAFVDATGERHYLAELLRLRAACLATAAGDRDAADACLEEAIRVAREQRARLWERRARDALAVRRAGAVRRHVRLPG